MFFSHLQGRTGRLVRGYDVLADFDGWTATPATEGAPGGRLNVKDYTADDLNWPLRELGGLKVELDLGRLTYVGEAQILTEAPLVIEITGPLDPNG